MKRGPAPIFMCVRMDQMRAKALAGDPHAIEMLAAVSPRDLPRRFLVAERDRQIERIADWLAGRLASSSANGLSLMIATAVERREAGRGLGATPPFDRLSATEREDLASQTDELLSWAPPAGRRGSGLSARAVRQILRANLPTFSCDTNP